MLTLKRNLDIRNWKDRAELTAALRAAGMGIDDAAIDFVSSRLTDEWFRIVTLGSCILKIGPKFSSGLQLSDWVQVIQSLYEFRDRPNLDEQVRRLCLPTHERLDTTLVLCVAFRLSRHGFKITFEPNGQGSSDLLLERTPYRLYAEVKRENPHVHRRFERAHDLLGKISGGVSDGIADFLRQRPVRLEINLSRLFSDGHVTKVVGEITTKAIGVPLEQEIPLESVRGSAFIVMPREAEFHYQKGFHLSRMVVGRTPIQVNSPAKSRKVHPRKSAQLKGIKQASSGSSQANPKGPRQGPASGRSHRVGIVRPEWGRALPCHTNAVLAEAAGEVLGSRSYSDAPDPAIWARSRSDRHHEMGSN